MRGHISEAQTQERDPEYIGGAFVPHKFAREEFALRFTVAFDEYIELRVLGVSRDLAAIEAFEMIRFGIDLQNADQVGMACDANPYVKQRYQPTLESKSIKTDLWSEKEAVNRLLRIVKDPNERGATRLNAITQLNILCGYVVLEDDANDRPAAGHSLKDYQRAHEEWVAAGGVAH